MMRIEDLSELARRRGGGTSANFGLAVARQLREVLKSEQGVKAMKFTVIGIERMSEGSAKIKLEGKLDGTIYTSQLFVHVPWREVRNFPIDSEHELLPYDSVADPELQPICGDLPTLKAMEGK